MKEDAEQNYFFTKLNKYFDLLNASRVLHKLGYMAHAGWAISPTNGCVLMCCMWQVLSPEGEQFENSLDLFFTNANLAQRNLLCSLRFVDCLLVRN